MTPAALIPRPSEVLFAGDHPDEFGHPRSSNGSHSIRIVAIAHLKRIRGSHTGRNSSWVFLGDLARSGALVLVTLWLTQLLTLEELGVYSASMAIGTTATFVSALGAPWLLMKRVTRGGTFADEWSRMVTTVAVGGVAAVAIVSLLRPLLLRQVSEHYFV